MVLINIYKAKHLEPTYYVFYLILYNSMIHSFIQKYLLSPYYIKDIVLGTGDYNSEQDRQKSLPSRGNSGF